jgi:hypothetical protein
MVADIEWYDDTDTLLTSAPPIEGDAGAAGTALELRLYNSKDGTPADALSNGRLHGLALPSGATSAVESGDELVDRHYVEARVVSGLGGKTAQPTQWTPLGAGSYLPLPALAAGEGLTLEFQVSAPADAQALQRVLVLSVVSDLSVVTSPGLTESGIDGVIMPIGDPNAAVLVTGSNVAENPGGADNEVQIGPLVWIAGRKPWAYHQQLIPLTAAAASNARYDLLSLAADGTLTVTAGVETTDPLGPDDVPATPTGEVAIAYVAVDDSGVIGNADITNLWSAGLYGFTATLLTATIGPGNALVDNSLTLSGVSQQVALTASETNSIWLRRNGLLAVTIDGEPPVGTRALLLHEAVTDGSGVTEHRDRRKWAGGSRAMLRFEWPGTQVAGVYRYAVNPFDRPAFVLPVRGLRAFVADSGVTGETRFGLEVDSDFDLTWASDLAGGDTDSPPRIAVAAADPRHLDAIPLAYEIAAGAAIRASVAEIPSGTASEDAVLEVLLWPL